MQPIAMGGGTGDYSFLLYRDEPEQINGECGPVSSLFSTSMWDSGLPCLFVARLLGLSPPKNDRYTGIEISRCTEKLED